MQEQIKRIDRTRLYVGMAFDYSKGGNTVARMALTELTIVIISLCLEIGKYKEAEDALTYLIKRVQVQPKLKPSIKQLTTAAAEKTGAKANKRLKAKTAKRIFDELERRKAKSARSLAKRKNREMDMLRTRTAAAKAAAA